MEEEWGLYWFSSFLTTQYLQYLHTAKQKSTRVRGKASPAFVVLLDNGTEGILVQTGLHSFLPLSPVAKPNSHDFLLKIEPLGHPHDFLRRWLTLFSKVPLQGFLGSDAGHRGKISPLKAFLYIQVFTTSSRERSSNNTEGSDLVCFIFLHVKGTQSTKNTLNFLCWHKQSDIVQNFGTGWLKGKNGSKLSAISVLIIKYLCFWILSRRHSYQLVKSGVKGVGTGLTALLSQQMHLSGVTWLYQIIWVFREEELHHLDLGNTVCFTSH